MNSLLSVSQFIDQLLGRVAKFGGWAGIILIVVVCYDVGSRYFGIPKPFGLNSTMIQESEYWFHSYLIVLVIGYGYIRQAHVRIDLLRETLSESKKYWIEIIGTVLFLVPYSILGILLSLPYAYNSFQQGEISKSQNGLSNIWMLKGGLVVLFALLLLAGISQIIKAAAGVRGQLPQELKQGVIGGDH
ncbi:MAG: TRAP transporter small permease subunit [Proteobacteria bacterium]|nr:TRAP transporter small permease subunit [Pseudomonadota bacterium]